MGYTLVGREKAGPNVRFGSGAAVLPWADQCPLCAISGHSSSLASRPRGSSDFVRRPYSDDARVGPGSVLRAFSGRTKARFFSMSRQPQVLGFIRPTDLILQRPVGRLSLNLPPLNVVG